MNSLDPAGWPNGDIYNGGVSAGAYWSVIGPGKNLQLGTPTSRVDYYFRKSTDSYLEFYDESSYPGKLPEPITLVGPADGNTVDVNGAVLSCELSQNSVGYQLLFGSDPYNMNYLFSDTAGLPGEVIDVFPFETTWWTVKSRDAYGSTIYADPISVQAANVVEPISNPVGQEYLTFIGYELVWKKRLSRTEFEYSFRMRVKNLSLYDVDNITMELISAPANITILNSKVFFELIPAGGEELSQDTFVVRIDRSLAVDVNDITWQITDEQEPYLPGDLNKDWSIDNCDLDIIGRHWLGETFAAPEQGLVAYWMLNDCTGATAIDSSGNDNNGTLINNVTWLPEGLFDGFIFLDGTISTSTGYITADSIPAEVAGGNFTLSIWIFAEHGGLFASFNTASGGSRLMLGNPGGSKNLRVYDNGWNDTGKTVLDFAVHHIVCTLDDANDVLKIYVDGNEVYTGFSTTSIAADDLFPLGQGYNGTAADNFFSGYIDEVVIHNRVLSDEEIQRLYHHRIIGDINNDKIVNFLDYTLFAGDWLRD